GHRRCFGLLFLRRRQNRGHKQNETKPHGEIPQSLLLGTHLLFLGLVCVAAPCVLGRRATAVKSSSPCPASMACSNSASAAAAVGSCRPTCPASCSAYVTSLAIKRIRE